MPEPKLVEAVAREPEMVETVTEALAALLDEWVANRIETSDLSRAAIQAMRRPSAAMIEAGIRYAEDSTHDGMGMQRAAAESHAVGLFDAMMERALAAPDEGEGL